MDKNLRTKIYKINLIVLAILIIPLTSYSLQFLQFCLKAKFLTYKDLSIFYKQVQILKSVYTGLSLLLFILILLTMFCRICLKVNPIIQDQPIEIRTLNSNINNLIENLIIFIILFTFYIIGSEEKNLLRGFAVGYFYLVVRVLYAVTYYVGAMIKFLQLRSSAFGFNLLLLSFLFLELFGWKAFEFLEVIWFF